MYINDIPNQMVSTCRLYADDINCILYRQIGAHTDSSTLQNDLLTLEKWERKWKVKLNIDKCMVLTVTLKNNPIKTH